CFVSLFSRSCLSLTLSLFSLPLPFTSLLFSSTLPLSHPSPTLVSFHTLYLYSIDSRSF
ncbi:hypothetical protein K457DRAFT_1835187, partial [Linnemannia elongata AG-77]